MRRSLIAGGAVALLLTVFAAVRVFAPGDTLDRSREPYPQPRAAYAHVYGELMRSPLLIGTWMRVYGAQNRVWADGPVWFGVPASALWAFRRWPAQLVGVVADDHVVVSKWSDGKLVAIDPETGRIMWRADAGVGATSYQGRRTGASTVYEPPGLYLAPVPDGRPVVVSERADGELTALSTGTGAVLWHRQFKDRPDCRRMFTGPRVVVVIDRCPVPSTVDVYAAATGQPMAAPPAGPTVWPVGCTVGRQGCTGLAGLGGGWLIGPDGGFTRAPALTDTDGWLAGRLVVHLADGRIVAHDPVTGAPAWSWPASSAAPAGARVVAVESGLVHVVTSDGDLFNIDAATGVEVSGYPAHVLGVHKPWVPGHVYASHGYVAIERLLPGGRPEQKDSQYYYPFPTVLLTGS